MEWGVGGRLEWGFLGGFLLLRESCFFLGGGVWAGGLQMRNHVFEKIFALRFSFERRIVGGRRSVRISSRVRRRPGGGGGGGLVGFAVGGGGG